MSKQFGFLHYLTITELQQLLKKHYWNSGQ